MLAACKTLGMLQTSEQKPSQLALVTDHFEGMLQSTNVVLMLFCSGATALRLSRRGLTGIAAAALVAPNAAQAEMKKLSPRSIHCCTGRQQTRRAGKGAQEWGLWRLDPSARRPARRL